MRRYADAADLIGQGLTDVTLLAQNQQNIAAQQQAAAMAAQGSWLEQRTAMGLPNWVLLLGGAVAVYAVVKK